MTYLFPTKQAIHQSPENSQAPGSDFLQRQRLCSLLAKIRNHLQITSSTLASFPSRLCFFVPFTSFAAFLVPLEFLTVSDSVCLNVVYLI